MPFDIEDGSLVVDSESVRTPIRFVTHDQAQKYCTWMGKRLPTEAEFEHAFRGADERAWLDASGGPKCAFANFLLRADDAPMRLMRSLTSKQTKLRMASMIWRAMCRSGWLTSTHLIRAVIGCRHRRFIWCCAGRKLPECTGFTTVTGSTAGLKITQSARRRFSMYGICRWILTRGF